MFFFALAPNGQQPVIDGSETIGLEANHPRVARTQGGEPCLLPPQDAGYADVTRLDPEGTGTAVVPDA